MSKKIVIIGAGIGGLTAGNLLAKKGHRVTLFESHSAPGGYTGGFRRKGFYFESGTLAFESSDMIFKVMKDIGVFDKIRFTRQFIAIRSATMDGICEKFIDLKKLIYSSYPLDKSDLDQYFAEIDKMLNAMMGVMKPQSAAAFFLYPIRLLQFLWLYRKYGKMTITDFSAQYFDPDSDLYRFFNSLGYPDMSAAIIPGAYFSFFDDYWTVEDGMQSWADVLADHFKELGGELLLRSPVEKILTEKGTATGVISRGKTYPADFVISAADYKKTFLELLDDSTLIPETLQSKIGKTAVSEGIFTVYLGLDLPAEKLRKYLKSPHVSFHDEKPGADIHDSSDENYFQKASVLIYSPSLHDPKLAPKGKSSLMIQTTAPYRWLDNWGSGNREKYRQLKEKVKKILIAKAQGVIPGLSNHIEFEDAATPLTYERYTGNTDGATSAWSWNPNNRFYKSIMGIKILTPIKNLLIGSCWSSQIGGVPSAIMAAEKCAKKIG